jgi:hypothetical protein
MYNVSAEGTFEKREIKKIVTTETYISGGSRSARRKPPTCRKQVTHKLYHLIEGCPVLKKTLSYRVWVNGITRLIYSFKNQLFTSRFYFNYIFDTLSLM